MNKTTEYIRSSSARVWILLSISLLSCSDFLNVDPPSTEIVRESVFTSDASATSAMNGVYSLMMSNTSFTRAGIEELTGIASDELINYSLRADQVQFYQNTVAPANSDVRQVFWAEAYKYVNNANGILEGLKGSTGISKEVRDQLHGEALFVRAFAHYYLQALFGDIPYLMTTDYKANSKASRIDVHDVYKLLEQDLLDAVNLLSDDFRFSQEERIRPNRYAATALLSKVYLDMGEWAKAEAKATEVIDKNEFFELTPINNAFLANNREAIWQLKPVQSGVNTPQAQLFILTAAPSSSSRRVSLRNTLVDSFEGEDARRDAWIGEFTGTSTWFYAYKYKIVLGASVLEYNTVFRLAEQYLNRAEARAHLNNLVGAAEDLNMIRNRAGLADIDAFDMPSLLDSILEERRHEFFAEWGHRWLDLKRMGKADVVLQPLKPDWQSTDALFPIPQAERLLNTNLTQNPGY